MAIASLTTWSTNDVLPSAALNANFATIRDHYNANAVEIVGNQTIAGTKTFSAASVFSLGLTVSASGITVTGNSTITGTLTALTGVTSSGTAAFANVTASGTLGVTGTSTLGATNTAALTCTTFVPSGLAQAGAQAAYLRLSGGDAGATPAINWNSGNVQRWRLTANATPTFANPVKGACYVLELQQDGTGSRTVTWTGATVVWPDGITPTLTTAANRKDLITLVCVDAASSGTYLGAVIGQNYNNTTS